MREKLVFILKMRFLDLLFMEIIHYKDTAFSLFDITAKKKISSHSGTIRSQNASNWAYNKQKRYCIILK